MQQQQQHQLNFNEDLEAVKSELMQMRNKYQQNQLEIEKSKQEIHAKMAEIPNFNEQGMAAQLQMESAKQSEICKRLLSIINTYMNSLPADVQAYTMTELEKTRMEAHQQSMMMSGLQMQHAMAAQQQAVAAAAAAAQMPAMFMQRPQLMPAGMPSPSPRMTKPPNGVPNGAVNAMQSAAAMQQAMSGMTPAMASQLQAMAFPAMMNMGMGGMNVQAMQAMQAAFMQQQMMPPQSIPSSIPQHMAPHMHNLNVSVSSAPSRDSNGPLSGVRTPHSSTNSPREISAPPSKEEPTDEVAVA